MPYVSNAQRRSGFRPLFGQRLERRELMDCAEEERQRWNRRGGSRVGSVPGGARSAVRAARRSARRFGSRASARSAAQRWLRDRSRSSRLRSLRARRRGPLHRRVLDGERARRRQRAVGQSPTFGFKGCTWSPRPRQPCFGTRRYQVEGDADTVPSRWARMASAPVAT